MRWFRRHWPIAIVTTWLAANVVGLTTIIIYSNTSGDTGEPEAMWNLPAEITLAQDRPTLVVFAHPKCPCTRATFSELERLQSARAGRFLTQIIFYEPQDSDASWRDTVLWNAARNYLDTTVHADPAGTIIDAAGARTSGTVALYSPEGALLYWGGITMARGHEGGNAGIDTIIALLDGQTRVQTHGLVFGCPLLGPDECTSMSLAIVAEACHD